VAATSRTLGRPEADEAPRGQEPKATGGRTFWRRAFGLLGSLLATGGAKAVDLPANRAEAMFHIYDGGGVQAIGPALLVRKSLADKVSLSAQYYVDSVSNASIDVVTTASPYKEKRTAYDFGMDYVVRDGTIKLGVSSSKEPDYTVSGYAVDVTQEVFGGMTTVSMGYSHANDKVAKKNEPLFADRTRHWQYRAGVTQILTPRVLASLNFEAISDDGFLGSPYRVARVFGATVPERNPRTRTSRSIKLAAVGDIGDRQAVRGEYRYFWDTWDIKAHTLEGGYSRYFGDAWLADAFVRFYSQDKALFYSDNALSEMLYLSRNRQLSTYNTFGLGGKVSYDWKRVPGQYELKLNGAFEFIRYNYKDFTDVRTGSPYGFNASVLQVYLSATF
jgi:hypothetical protein